MIAERQLSQQFRDLKAIVPGMEKMDEVTLLDNVIIYLKQLQERVKVLEEKNSKKTMKPGVFGEKLRILYESDENITGEPELFPLVAARVSERNILIRIHCGMRKGVLVKVLEETEKCNLSVVNSSAMPFGASTLEITIVAKMNDEFKMTVEDLVKAYAHL